MSINGIMNNALTGMNATQLATNITSSNIANSATVGYTRRSADVNPSNLASFTGAGGRVVEPFIQKRLLTSQASAGDAKAQNDSVQVLDTVFAEGDGSLGDAVDKFQASLQNLSARPDDTATRQSVLATAGNLATAFQNANAALQQARQDSNQAIDADLQNVNAKLTQIGQLNVQIQQTELNGSEAGDLRDQRDQLLGQVAGSVPITVIDQGNGQTSVLLGGGQQLVSPDGTASQLSAKFNDDGSVSIQKQTNGVSTDVSSMVTSGSVGGNIKTRDGALAQAQQKLDQLAFNTAKAYNDVHSQNVGTDGQSGRNLFDAGPTVSGAAGAFSVSADVAGQPAKIAAATDANTLPSDNSGAMALANLATAPLSTNGETVSEALASLVGFAGTTVQAASQQQDFASGALQQVQALQDSTSGVNTDEEMVNLMKYQRAYQATLKVISVADQMYSDLLAMKS